MSRMTLYLPKTADSYVETLEWIQNELATRHGGFTQFDGNGCWKDDDGNVIQEPVTVLEVFTDMGDGLEAWAENLADEMQFRTEEDAIAYAVDGEMNFAKGDPRGLSWSDL